MIDRVGIMSDIVYTLTIQTLDLDLTFVTAKQEQLGHQVAR